MNAIWNKIDLEHPPNTTWRIIVEKFDVKTFFITIDKIIKDLNSMDNLHMEAALLSRLIYRMKTKFRNDKGLKHMEKMNKALINYLNMTLGKEYTNLKCCTEKEDKVICLPSRQMLEYVLVRTQGFAKLMVRVEEVARYSAHFFKTRITLGHAWTISLIAYAVVSRIWLLSRHLIKRSCKWYNELHRYLEIFPIVGLSWLPQNQILPHNLKSWLSLEWIDENVPCISNDKNWKDTMFKLLKAETIDTDDDLINIANEISLTQPNDITNVSQENISNHHTLKNESTLSSDINDIGEVINRKVFEKSFLKVPSNVGIISAKPCKRAHYNNNSTREELGDFESSKLKKYTESKMILFDNVNSQNVELQNIKNINKTRKKQKRLNDKVKRSNQDILILDNITTKSDFIALLDRKSYPHIDKLRWNMIKNNGKKYLGKLQKCRDSVREAVILEKAIRHLRSWINS